MPNTTQYLNFVESNDNVTYPSFTMPTTGVFTLNAFLSLDAAAVAGTEGRFNVLHVQEGSVGFSLNLATPIAGINLSPRSSAGTDFNGITGAFPNDGTPFLLTITIDMDTAVAEVYTDGVFRRNHNLTNIAEWRGLTFNTAPVTRQGGNSSVSDAKVYYVDINGTAIYSADLANGTGSLLPDELGGTAATLNDFTVDDTQWGDTESVVDVLAPVISITPTALTYNLTTGDSFTNPVGAFTDNTDGTGVVNPSGAVDTATEGTYTLTYAHTDVAGNIGAPIVVTVNVSLPELNMSIQGLPDGQYDIDLADPATGELIERKIDVEFVGGDATTTLVGSAGMSVKYSGITATHFFGDIGVTI